MEAMKARATQRRAGEEGLLWTAGLRAARGASMRAMGSRPRQRTSWRERITTKAQPRPHTHTHEVAQLLESPHVGMMGSLMAVQPLPSEPLSYQGSK